MSALKYYPGEGGDSIVKVTGFDWVGHLIGLDTW